MQKNIRIFTAFSACLAVLVLALAAHALPRILPVETVNSIETAGYLQLIHAIALLALSPQVTIYGKSFGRGLKLMALGSSLFSYSIYFISLKYVSGLEFAKFVWPITPLGGIVLCAAWFLLGISMIKKD